VITRCSSATISGRNNRFQTQAVVNRPRRRKHLERRRKIEDLDVVEDQTAHRAWLRTIHVCCGSQVRSGLIAQDIQRRARHTARRVSSAGLIVTLPRANGRGVHRSTHWHPFWLERRDLAGIELPRLNRRLRTVSEHGVRQCGRTASSPGEARICRPNL
jgi:hypothetical protein